MKKLTLKNNKFNEIQFIDETRSKIESKQGYIDLQWLYALSGFEGNMSRILKVLWEINTFINKEMMNGEITDKQYLKLMKNLDVIEGDMVNLANCFSNTHKLLKDRLEANKNNF